ncbi:MAG TPA: AtpZ/AtpI family protein [Caulobacteraceae bacterium]
MPESNDPSAGALNRLDKRLGAFEASRRARPSHAGIGGAAGDGYRLLGQMLGGVLGGLGLGWALDHFARTGPWGIVGGLIVGAGLSIYATVQTASRISARAAKPLSGAGVPHDSGEDT